MAGTIHDSQPIVMLAYDYKTYENLKCPFDVDDDDDDDDDDADDMMMTMLMMMGIRC